MTQKINQQCRAQHLLTCTKATTAFSSHMVSMDIPADVRALSWFVVQQCIETSCVFLGKGVFGKCYRTELGPTKVCFKVYQADKKYAVTFFNEVRMLHMLFHGNLPLLLGACNNYKHPNIMVMSYHPFNGQTESQTVHAALKTTHLTKADWKQVLLGCASALAYLAKMKALHNIKTDNILVEYLAPEYKQCRSIVDFGKARYASEAKLYHLSQDQKEKYKLCHPQVAPEVRDGICKQSFASDIYSFGRIMQHINGKLQIPVLKNLADQCVGMYKERPSAEQLLTFLSNLFEE